jgi:short-subunit dehydrogenase
MTNWKDVIAVVTGGSTGIGRATVLELSRRGAAVLAIARSRDNLETLARDATGIGGGCEIASCDVGDAASAAAVLRGFEAKHGRIDVLVNNAGTGAYSPASRMTAADYEPVLRTNFLGAVACTLAVLPGMTARRSGRIVNVSSPMSFAPAPGQSAYAASKAALDAFSESLLLEVRDEGVVISIVYPGYVVTPLTETVYREQPPPPKSVHMPPERVADAILAVVESGKFQTYLPWFSGLAPVVKAIAPEFLRRQTARTQPLRSR